ncbi:hypothetical protein DPMN_110437 [Dreissena polymorpha]|uniref:Uncharacterized protein n=1 Tax=Dreissena polymorpha TaxID=45954 RepID=A0A9D4QN39_DREPO|nr:hypothetical protein DPMN_110437 [Dreissena polymorpha]
MLRPRIMRLHRYIDHDWQMTPIDFQVTRYIDHDWQMTPIDFQVTSIRIRIRIRIRILKELELADEEFKGYFRLNKQQFGYFLSLVEEFISKKSVTRQTIGAKQRLAICLR